MESAGFVDFLARLWRNSTRYSSTTLASGAWSDWGRPWPKPGVKAEVSPATCQALAGLAKGFKKKWGSRGQAASLAWPGWPWQTGAKAGLENLAEPGHGPDWPGIKHQGQPGQ